MSETPAAPQITGRMFLYERPELLNPGAHGALGLKPLDRPFGFVSSVRAVPLTVSEIAAAARDYPVVFLSAEEPAPMAVVGLVDEENLFVDEEGRWDNLTYVPGYVRRYPFSVAREESGDRAAIVIDAAFPGLVADGELRLFENGEPTDYTKEAIEFSKRYEQDRMVGGQALEMIKKFDLIANQTAQYTPNGASEPQPFAQYFGIDEQKLRDLPDDQHMELRRTNLLPVLYAQLMSMGNWRSLVQRRATRHDMTEASVFSPKTVS
ncbi:MAG: SapC family protein [Parvularculaceae bacterium]